MLPMGLDSGGRRLVVGRKLRLLQMARSSWQSSAVSAGAATVLVAPVAVSTPLSSANADANTASTSMLVLHQRTGCFDHAGGMSGKGGSMLSDQRRSAQA